MILLIQSIALLHKTFIFMHTLKISTSFLWNILKLAFEILFFFFYYCKQMRYLFKHSLLNVNGNGFLAAIIHQDFMDLLYGLPVRRVLKFLFLLFYDCKLKS